MCILLFGQYHQSVWFRHSGRYMELAGCILAVVGVVVCGDGGRIFIPSCKEKQRRIVDTTLS